MSVLDYLKTQQFQGDRYMIISVKKMFLASSICGRMSECHRHVRYSCPFFYLNSYLY